MLCIVLEVAGLISVVWYVDLEDYGIMSEKYQIMIYNTHTHTHTSKLSCVKRASDCMFVVLSFDNVLVWHKV